PARDALLDYLRCQSNSTLAGLYALYRLGDYPCSAAEAAKRYRYSYELADQPIHHPHAAADLVAKAPLAHGLRSGLEQLGLRIESGPADAPSPAVQRTTGSPREEVDDDP